MIICLSTQITERQGTAMHYPPPNPLTYYPEDIKYTIHQLAQYPPSDQLSADTLATAG